MSGLERLIGSCIFFPALNYIPSAAARGAGERLLTVIPHIRLHMDSVALPVLV